MAEIHRWISGTGDPLVEGSWQSCVAPGVAAQVDLTFSLVAVNNETVTIAGLVYTFKTSINNGTPREVYHGASATASAANLAAAINAGAGAGTEYSTATVSHVITNGTLSAVLGSNPSAGVMRATAYSFGVAANSLAVSETSTVAVWTTGTLLGGVRNWANDAIARFDGTSIIACQGTDRLDDIPFRLNQTEDAEHDIGSAAVPFRWNQFQYPYAPTEHVLAGGGSVYLAGAVAPIAGQGGYLAEFKVDRFEGPGYLEFQQNPGRLLVLSGKVVVKGGSASLGPIILDGLGADVTVVSGGLGVVRSRNGRFKSQSTISNALGTMWIITGGVLETSSPMGSLSKIYLDGGILRLLPTNLVMTTPSVQFFVSDGVLDLSEAAYYILGRSLVLPPGEIWGNLFQPGL